MTEDRYDFFLNHASEDKAKFVDGLCAELVRRGRTVWYDRFEIKVGDDFRIEGSR